MLSFHSLLALLLDQDIGFFVSCNSAECRGFPEILFKAFMVHYYPEADAATTPTPDFDARVDLVAGRYRFNQMSYTTAEKLTGLFSSAKFSVMDDGTLLIGGLNLRFVEVAPFVFRQVNGEDTLIF